MNILSLLITSLVVNWLLTAYCIRLGARWLGARKATYGWALTATTIMTVVNLLFFAGAVWAMSQIGGNLIVLMSANVAHLLLSVLIPILTIQLCLRVTFVRSIPIMLLSLVPSIVGVVGVNFLLKPYVLEAFVVSSNNMAPTIIGWHKTGKCPHCGGATITSTSPPDEVPGFAEYTDTQGICTQCLKTSKQKFPAKSRGESPDRIIVDKLVTPRRWDLIEFRYPVDPSLRYLDRLVGLPGETVFIKDGFLWVDGKKVTPPDHLANLRYVVEIMERPIVIGTEDRPWRLQQDEFCVLGDNTERSSDSREWGVVPRANIEGVVVLRYWPFSRWALLR